MLRRLYHEQPASFSFTPANTAWAEAQMTKFPKGRQASAVIPLLWRAQEQEGWLSRPAIEEVGRMLDMAYIRVLEVATFYFMFQLQPVGSVAHVQICGTTSCMICGAEDLVAVCREKIARSPHALSADGRFSWEEVECLGACANAPMAQIGKDYYEDLTAERLAALLDEMAEGAVPVPGPQNGRYAAEPASGLTSLTEHAEGRARYNASAARATELGDTLKRIDGTEEPLVTPWLAERQDGHSEAAEAAEGAAQDPARDDLMPPSVNEGETPGPRPSEGHPVDETGVTVQEAEATEAAKPEPGDVAPEQHSEATGDQIAQAGEHTAAGSTAPASDEGLTANAPKSADDDTAEPTAEPAAGTAGAGEGDAGEAGDDVDAVADEDALRPAGLSEPRNGRADDLKRIRGIDPKLEDLLHQLGVWHFDQIAGWSAAEAAWVDRNFEGARGLVRRDRWVAQARQLARGGETG